MQKLRQPTRRYMIHVRARIWSRSWKSAALSAKAPRYVDRSATPSRIYGFDEEIDQREIACVANEPSEIKAIRHTGHVAGGRYVEYDPPGFEQKCRTQLRAREFQMATV